MMGGGGASESAYRVLMGVLESRTGQTLSPNRIWRIEMSLKPVMQRHGVADLDALVGALVTSNSRQLLDDTVDAMLNNETYFYREHSVFDDISSTALEHLRKLNAACRRITIWHCGVSTGQEAYSIAMLLAEQDAKWAGWQVDIVGTDVSIHAISRARIGLYSQFEIQRGLPVQRMVRWFDQTDGGWLAKADIRRRIDFSVQNMLTDRPPLASPADLIFCRNLLLYFSLPMRQKAFAKLRAMAAPQSFLVLGAGETVLGQTDQFVASPRLRGLYEPADQQARCATAA
ncbi:chemotaxis protein methyltransferase CheR [Sphingopyxis panaciterrae]|uniref:CheR family methyltransferase n=1 Tax=Sphingopyxis panaciterrae TaxID=363841 RepID=UPI001FB90C7D|nr:protein-glutamate O-methyltransferase CheR [Sphingopyxis panaciterrae]NIJ36149.1 chemotaxis protein methyltransferase CheR [Sphingopyxis panaciterrae]